MAFHVFALVCSSSVFVCALLNALKTRSRAMFALAVGFALDNLVCANNLAVGLVASASADLTRAENIGLRKILFYSRVALEIPADILVTVALAIILVSIAKRRQASTGTEHPPALPK
jgi:hypothetical protein